MTSMTVPERCNGPSGSGHGGVSAGLLAAFLPAEATVEVTLRRPPPLESALRVDLDGDSATAHDGDTLVAEARVVDDDATGAAVAPVDAHAARMAMASFVGLTAHPFPVCFGCGTERAGHDGLDAFPGPVGPRRVATTYLPKPAHFAPAFPAGVVLAWAVLDCPGGWATDLRERRAVLGRMATRVFQPVREDESYVVVAELDGTDGRKAYSRVSLYGPDGSEYARARQTWITV